jgi:hypothetical protein
VSTKESNAVNEGAAITFGVLEKSMNVVSTTDTKFELIEVITNRRELKL